MMIGSERAALLRRFAGFAGLPLISLLAPFLLLPIIARVGGTGGWAAILVGQAVGGLGGVVAGLGWSLVGPSAVARALPSARANIYARALVSQVVVISAVIPACGAVAIISIGSHQWSGVAMATAMVIGALSPAWYSIGVGRASYIATYEILPRLVATGLAAVAVITTRQLWTYPALLVVASVVGTALFARRVAGVRLSDLLVVRPLIEIWASRAASGTVAVGSSYSQSPLLVVSAVESTGGVATFGSADRLLRLNLMVIQVTANALQGWVSETRVPVGNRITRRMRTALLVQGVVGVAGLTGFAFLAPLVTRILFTADLAASRQISFLYGAAFLAIALNTALGRLILVPLGRTREVFASTVVGAVVGLGSMVVFGMWVGATGVAAGFALSEFAVTGYQAVMVMRIRPESRPSP